MTRLGEAEARLKLEWKWKFFKFLTSSILLGAMATSRIRRHSILLCFCLISSFQGVCDDQSIEREIENKLLEGNHNSARKLLSLLNNEQCILIYKCWIYLDSYQLDSFDHLQIDTVSNWSGNSECSYSMRMSWRTFLSGNLAESDALVDSAINSTQSCSDAVFQQLLALKGAIARSKADFVLANSVLIERLSRASSITNKIALAKCLVDLSYLLLDQGQFEEAIQICDSALSFMDTTIQSLLYARTLDNKAACRLRISPKGNIAKTLLKTGRIFRLYDSHKDLIRNRSNLAYIYDYISNDYKLAESTYLMSIEHLRESRSDPEAHVTLLFNYAQMLSFLDRINEAFVLLEEAQHIAKKKGLQKLLFEVYKSKASLFIELNVVDSCELYFLKYDSLKSVVNALDKTKSIAHIHEQYDTEKLETENALQKRDLETEKRKRMTAVISLVALSIITTLLVTIYQQRLKTKTQLSLKNEELHLQKLDELAKQKELEKITTLMEGQEQERKRIAGELHDGLGSLLATIKHHFEVVEDKMDTNKEEYTKAYSLLDKASEEVRRISHNMASNVLSKFGLVAALQDLCEVVNSSKRLKIILKVTGLEDRLESSAEIHLFRICQELVSNALKHAHASTITLQLTMHKDALNLIVEDNGIGFDTEAIEKKEGMGLENLKARVAHLNGTIEIDSVIDRGTTVVIDVPV